MKSAFWVPNSITTANIFCGFFSILSTLHGDFKSAAWAIVLAGLFDLFDGRIARLLNACSAFGENYDTLSDLTSFGVAPALLLAQMTAPLGTVAATTVSFAYLIAVAFRLARFSVQTTEAKVAESATAGKANFSGMSSPPSALTLCGFVLMIETGNLPAAWPAPLSLAIVSLCLAVLMASRIPFPSFKSVVWRSRQGSVTFTVMIVGLALIIYKPQIFLFSVGVFFVCCNLLWNLARMMSDQRSATSK